MNIESESQEPVLDHNAANGTTIEESSPPPALMNLVRQLSESVAYYVAAQTDVLKLAARKAILSSFLIVLAFIAVSAVVVFSVWLLLSGTAIALDQLMGGRSWAGPVATGALVLLSLAGGIYCTIARINAASRKSTVLKFETRLARQRVEFGRDIHDDKT